MGRRVRGRRSARLAPTVLAAALLSSGIIAASVTGTLSSFTASIQNSTNTAVSGSLVMKETDSTGNTICLSTDGNTTNTATCGTINKYGGTGTPLTPGAATATTVVKISNAGSTGVSGFTLGTGTCTPGTANTNLAASNGNLCSKLKLRVVCTLGSSTTTIVSDVALNALAASYDIKQLSSGGCVPGTGGSTTASFSFVLTMDSGADSSVQNQTVSQPLTWTFNGV